jgi:hypothetical protein
MSTETASSLIGQIDKGEIRLPGTAPWEGSRSEFPILDSE